MADTPLVFDPLQSIVPGKSLVVFTPTGGTAVKLIGTISGYDDKIEKTVRKVPDVNGVLRPDRIVLIGEEETLDFESPDVKRLKDIFGGLNGGLKQGTAELFVVDPEDTTGKVAGHSNTFKCSCELSGGLKFDHGKDTTYKLQFTAKEKVTITPDATATLPVITAG